MNARIKGVIEREKQKNPTRLPILLLINRVIKVCLRDIRHFLTRDSTFISEDSMFMCSLFPQKVLDIIILKFKPKSVLDVGCGTGVSLSYFIDNGIDAWGIENSDLAVQKSKYPEKILKYNLKHPVDLKRKFDLLWCFEVIEHIHPAYEENVLKTLTSHSALVILSAAKPGQKGHGHFNEKPEEYWIEKFRKLGFIYDSIFSSVLKETKEMHSDNLMAFRFTDNS